MNLLPEREGTMHMIENSQSDLVDRISERCCMGSSYWWSCVNTLGALFPCARHCRTHLVETFTMHFTRSAVTLAGGIFASLCIRQRQSDVTYRIIENTHPVQLPTEYRQMIQRVRNWWGYTKSNCFGHHESCSEF